MNDSFLNFWAGERRSIYSVTVCGNQFSVARAPVFYDSAGSIVIEPLYRYDYDPSIEVVSTLHDNGCVVYCEQAREALDDVVATYANQIILPSTARVWSRECDEDIRNLPESTLGARIEKGIGGSYEYVLYWKGEESDERTRSRAEEDESARIAAWSRHGVLEARFANTNGLQFGCRRLDGYESVTDETIATSILKDWIALMVERGFLKSLAEYQFTMKLEQKNMGFVTKASLF